MFLSLLLEIPLSFYIGYGSVIFFLLLISGFISGSEVAFFNFLNQEIEKPTPTDARVMRLIAEPRRLLASVLILNNLVNVLIVTISTYATWQIVGTMDKSAIVLTILTSVVTILIILFGEITPKVFASHNPLAYARFAVGYFEFFNKILTPASWFLTSLSTIIERRVKRKGYNLSVDELNQALELTSSNTTSQEEKGILRGIVNFGTLSVKQVMRSRMDITAIDVESDYHELMDQINKTGFSRIPVFKETIDKIEGILYIKDLLPHLNQEDDFNWQSLLRPGYFVPESKKIDDLFKDFQEKQVHMAIVIDEYGGTEGLITMEDIIEEIVGEINDEFDEEEDDILYKKIDPNTFIFEGKTSLNDVCKLMRVDAAVFDNVKGESESLGGLLLELNAKLPSAGEKINFSNFLFTIVAVDQKRIKRVRVFAQPNKLDIIGNYED